MLALAQVSKASRGTKQIPYVEAGIFDDAGFGDVGKSTTPLVAADAGLSGCEVAIGLDLATTQPVAIGLDEGAAVAS